jgi:hypothetical protein
VAEPLTRHTASGGIKCLLRSTSWLSFTHLACVPTQPTPFTRTAICCSHSSAVRPRPPFWIEQYNLDFCIYLVTDAANATFQIGLRSQFCVQLWITGCEYAEQPGQFQGEEQYIYTTSDQSYAYEGGETRQSPYHASRPGDGSTEQRIQSKCQKAETCTARD